MTTAQYGSLPFQEQIAFFRAKTLVSTQRWNDLVREQHDAGFMVAKAVSADLLADLQGAVDKAITKGTTFAEFQKDFEEIVAKHGWTGWRGEDTPAGRAWRARLIYDTNLRTSYQAGRWAQVQETKATRPYLIYRHSDAVTHPRPLHVSWDGLVVRIDDPWVKPHWPPNGWGCKCRMFSLSERDLKKMGKSGPDTPPDDGSYEWTDKKTGEVHTFPNGIDPFWDYAPGASKLEILRKEIQRKAEAYPDSIRKALTTDLERIQRQNLSMDDYIARGRQASEELIASTSDPDEQFLMLLSRLHDEVGTSAPIRMESRGAGASLVREVSMRFPDSWTSAADSLGPLFVAARKGIRGCHWTAKPEHAGMRVELPVFGVVTPTEGAGYISIRSGDVGNAVHEVAHRLQAALPELDAMFQELHRTRTEGESLIRLMDLYPGFGYKADEVCRKDQYLTAYWGKEYGSRGSLEVMTMALETVLGYDSGVAFRREMFSRLIAEDRAMFDFVVGVLLDYKP